MSTPGKPRPALGRGMAALLSNAPPPSSNVAAIPGRALLMLPVEAIERNPRQPRKQFEEAKLDELAASIRAHGVMEPILVRKDGGRYRIVAGERRWRAAQRAGLAEVPAVVREASEKEAFELNPGERLLTRSCQPVPLTPKTFDTLLCLVRSGLGGTAGATSKKRSTGERGMV